MDVPDGDSPAFAKDAQEEPIARKQGRANGLFTARHQPPHFSASGRIENPDVASLRAGYQLSSRGKLRFRKHRSFAPARGSESGDRSFWKRITVDIRARWQQGFRCISPRQRESVLV